MTPTPLTDEEIVRTLAEFMGYRSVAFCSCCNCWTGRRSGPQGGGGPLHAPQLLFLTSYDALAPVWAKWWDEYKRSPKPGAWAWWNDQTDGWWFHSEPRELARVLAKAIKESKDE